MLPGYTGEWKFLHVSASLLPKPLSLSTKSLVFSKDLQLSQH